jgi:hypothetical protein
MLLRFIGSTSFINLASLLHPYQPGPNSPAAGIRALGNDPLRADLKSEATGQWPFRAIKPAMMNRVHYTMVSVDTLYQSAYGPRSDQY